MRTESLGEAVTHLSWLAPSVASLVALARPDAATWQQIHTDPGAVLLVLRFADPAAYAAGSPARPGSTRPLALPPFTPALIREPRILAGALQLFDRPAAADWNDPRVEPIYRQAVTYAETAAALAERTERVDREIAWIAGLLTPLGWLAAAAFDPGATNSLIAGGSGSSAFEQAAVARRLVRRWNLPAWLGSIIGYLALPVEMAVALGADAELFHLLQLTIALSHKNQRSLGIETGIALTEAAAALELSAATLEEFGSRPVKDSVRLPSRWQAPAEVPMLRHLLELAEENRRLENAPLLERLEQDLDALQRTLVQQRSTEAQRLQELKLGTLAEFAAGASHEINNPLAVISGQAQYLLGHLQDFRLPIDDGQLSAISADATPAMEIENRKSKPENQERALKTIIGQAQRIHDLLNQLMQFARPAKPQKRLLDLGSVIREVALELAEVAQTRNVRLVCPEVEPFHVYADPRHLRMALTGLLRNGIEAAPPEGWAGVRVIATADVLEILVEDSGPGPTPAQLAHMFDPFYSGRQAGRGRGLGLPTAWRLAHEQGGDVSFDDKSDGPTRFVLRLPRTELGGAVQINDVVSTNSPPSARPAPAEIRAKAG